LAGQLACLSKITFKNFWTGRAADARRGETDRGEYRQAAELLQRGTKKSE